MYGKDKKTILDVEKKPKEFFSDSDIVCFIKEASGLSSSTTIDCSSGEVKIIERRELLKWQLERIAKGLFFWQEYKNRQSHTEIFDFEPTLPSFDDYPTREKRADDVFDSFIDQLCYVWQDTFQRVEIKTSYNFNKQNPSLNFLNVA